MRAEAQAFLAIIREANRQKYWMTVELAALLRAALLMTEEELLEIGEILKADAREQFASSPHFGEINAILMRMGPNNPFGK
jgi:hypothetical protein